MAYDWDFSIIWQYRLVFWQGAIWTVLVTAGSIFCGTLLGILLSVLRLARPWWLRVPAFLIIELLLALPVLVLLIWIYYCGPLIGLRLSGFWTAVLALSLSLSAFVEEVIRGGLASVPPGSVEAGRVLGLSRFQTLRWIVLPQALRVMTPPLLGQYISCLKLSSLASVIAVYELLHSAQNLITTTYRPLEIYTAVAGAYVVLILPLSLVTRRIEASKSWKLS